MFYIEWDLENNGVVLRLEKTERALSVSPRPVFHEELDMLGMNKYWAYEKSKSPLCWACGRKYYANGSCIMETKGGNMYDSPEVIVHSFGKDVQLAPIDVEKIYKKNEHLLFYLEYEALQFLHANFSKYAQKRKDDVPMREKVNWEKLRELQEQIEKKPMAVVQQSCGSFDIMPMEDAHSEEKNVISGSKVEEVIVSFSGGKDSQVVLDLAMRVLAPSSFDVVYGDTGYELPSSLELYEETLSFYKKTYPNLQFDITKNQQDVMYYWEKMGAPSRMHRWCCSVMKTAPLYRYLKNKSGREKQPKVLVFEGVRGEESTRRSEYLRVGSSVKHRGVINARPIFMWNSTEVYLYILRRNLPFNRAYREGLSRVGCALCPYSTGWSEHIVMKNYPETMAPFISHLESRCRDMRVQDIDTYIKDGMWKMRGGSRTLLNRDTTLEVLKKDDDLVLLLVNPQENFFEWIKVIGDYTQRKVGDTITGEIYRKHGRTEYVQPYIYEVLQGQNVKVTFPRLPSYPELQSIILKVINKITYCVHCEACEVECPTGALQVTPSVEIDSTKCIHCLRCVEFKDKGCMMAKSVSENIFNTSTNKKMNPDRYNTFGLQQEWLVGYMSHLDNFFETDHGLNATKQVPALKKWLREACLLSNTDTTPTALAKMLVEHQVFPANQRLIWEIIWSNLVINSPICSMFINMVPAGQSITKKDLIAKVAEAIGAQSERTAKNAVDAFINLINKSYIKNMRMFAIEMKGRTVISISRLPYTPLAETIAYAIFQFGKRYGTHFLSVTELMASERTDSLDKQFGLNASTFEPLLRRMQNQYGLADVQLSMGLDNVILSKDITPDFALKIALQKS